MADTEMNTQQEQQGEERSPEQVNYDLIGQYLNGKGEEKPGYARKLICNLDNKLPYVDIIVRAYSQGYGAVLQFPVNSGKNETEPQVIRLLTRINDNMKFGQFNYDLDTGNVYFKYSSLSLPEGDLFNFSLQLGIRMVESYGDAILAVMFGLMSADEAYENAKRKN